MQNLRILAARAHGHIAAARRSAARRRGAGVRFTVAAAFAGLVAAACGESPLANRAPVVTDELSGAEVFVGDSLTVDLAGHFEDPDGDALRYEAESSPPEEAGVAVAGSVLTVTVLTWGEAVVTVTARDPEGLAADQALIMTAAPVLRRLPKIGFGREYSPAWSPDGARIAFGSVNSLNELDPEIYVVDTDGSNMERLTNNIGFDMEPAWSPDGARIAFMSTRDGSWEIYVMNADGSDVEPLTNNGGGNPAWSPDGARIAFASTSDGSAEIYVMNADGSDVERLTNNSAADWSPAWSPDGARIAFASDRDTNGKWREIYVMNADGGDVERLTDSDVYGAWSPAWSPGGTEIAFERDRAIYVAHIAVR